MKISELKTTEGTLYFSNLDLKYNANYHYTLIHKNIAISTY